MHIQNKINHIFGISMLLLHVSALYERHLQGDHTHTFHLGYKNQSVYAVSGQAQTALFKVPVRTAL
jgi:hypothetical protein